MESKKPWLSKTLWVNLIMCLCAVAWPAAQEYLAFHPDVMAIIFTVINMFLRLVTKDAIQLIDDKPKANG